MKTDNKAIQFVLKSWSTWPPVVSASEEELGKLQNALLSSLPGQVKRRLSPLAKTVFSALLQCEGVPKQVPVVFSSTHGELGKSLEMIKLIEAGEEISPTAFSLSVHNAIAGLISIAFGNTSEITVLAPGEEGIAPAFIEAIGLLMEGVEAVLLVFYDEPLPDFYPSEPFQLSTVDRNALAMQIGRSGDGMALQFHRKAQGAYTGEQPIQLPKLIDFLAGTQTELCIQSSRQSWHWQKLDMQH